MSGYKIGGRQHKLECQCRACGMVRSRKRERAIRNVLFEWHC